MSRKDDRPTYKYLGIGTVLFAALIILLALSVIFGWA